MKLFLSTTVNRIDKKGRVSVPAQFRSVLADENFNGVILFKSYTKQTIEGVGISALEKMSSRMDDNFAFFSDNHDDMATILFGESVQCGFDSEGRISVPQQFLEYAGIADNIAFVGLGQKFQLWNPEKFEERRHEARQSVQNQKISLPKGLNE